MTQQYCKWHKINDEWLVAVPLAYHIDPVTRKVPIKKYGNNKISFITVENEPIMTRNLPSGTYQMFQAKRKSVQLEKTNQTD